MTPLAQTLRTLRITSYSDLKRYDDIVERLRSSVADRAQKLTPYFQNESDERNLWVSLSASELRHAKKRHLETLATKLSMYCPFPIIELPSVPLPSLSKDYERRSRDSNDKRLKMLWDNFVEPVLALEEVSRRDIVIVVPGSIGNRAMIPRAVRMKFSPIYLSNSTLRANLMESDISTATGHKLNLYLPHLSGLGWDRLQAFKDDNKDAFEIFYGVVRKFLISAKSVGSESKLLELMGEIDFQVRKMRDRASELAKQASSRNIKVITGSVALTLTLLTKDQNFATEIFRCLGGLSMWAGIWEIAETKDKMRSELKSDFYIPWSVDRLSSQHINNNIKFKYKTNT